MKCRALLVLLSLVPGYAALAEDWGYVVANRNGTHFLAAAEHGGKCYKVKGDAEFELQWKCVESWVFTPDEVFLSADGDTLIILPHVVALEGKESDEVAMMIFSKGKKIKVHKVGALVNPKTDVDRLRIDPEEAHIFMRARFSRWAEIRRDIRDDDFHAKAMKKGWGPEKELFWIEASRGKNIVVDASTGEVVLSRMPADD